MPRDRQTLAFSKRFYVPRCIGLSLGFLAVFTSLSHPYQHQVVLGALIFYCFAWPHLAYLLARTSSRPVDAERRSMLLDAFSAGFFAGAIGFNPIPAAAIVTMITMNNVAMGGPRFMVSGFVVSLLGAVLAYFTVDTAFNADLSQLQIAACLPLLVLYPLSLGYVCYLTAIKLTEQKKQLRQMSKTDHLTGLANRAALNELLDASFDRSRSGLERSALGLIDVDGFKQINDTYGHTAGDQTLQKISDIMRACVREQDTVGRYGGDEFCVILRNVTKSEAFTIFERMRSLAEQNMIILGGEKKSTLSIGAAMHSAQASTSALWIHLADKAMYEAKNHGRNKVVFAT